MKRLIHFLPPTFLLACSALLSSLLGVFRDHLLAKTFGATKGVGIYNLDAYYAAFRIPDLLYFILVSGAISAAFIPIFIDYKKSGQLQKAWEFASNMLHLLLILVSFLAVLGFIFAPYLAQIVGAGFEAETFDLTVKLMRIMFLSPIIFTLSSVLMSLQDAFKTFFFRSLFPIFYNLGIIFSIYFFADTYGVIGLAWGVILGALISLLIQLPALKLLDYRHRWILNYKNSDIKTAFRLMGPRILTIGMSQLLQVIFTLMASFLAVGSIAILYFSNNLYSLPLSMIAVAFSITSFATLSELALEKTSQAFALEIKKVMQQTLFLILPATFGLLLLGEQVIGTLLFAGKFTLEDVQLTAQVLFFMIFSLFAHSLTLILIRGFYAYQDTQTPFYATFWGAVMGIILAAWLTFYAKWGVLGIGLASTVSNLVTFFILYFLMRKKVRRSILNLGNLFKMLLASLGMSLVVYGAKFFLSFPTSTLLKMTYLLLMGILGMLIYFSLAGLFKIPELKMLIKPTPSHKSEAKVEAKAKE